MSISWMCVIVYEKRTVVSQCATLCTIISIYSYSLNNIQWISFTHIFSRLLLLCPFTTTVVLAAAVIVIIISYSCCNACCKVNETYTKLLNNDSNDVCLYTTILHGMVVAVVVVSKHIIIKKNCRKNPQHNTKQSKVEWIKKNLVCNKTKASLIWIVYNLCTNMDMAYGYVVTFLQLLLLPHTSNHCWMNEQTNCIKRTCAFLSVFFFVFTSSSSSSKISFS